VDVHTAQPAPGAPTADEAPRINATVEEAKAKIEKLWSNPALTDPRHPDQKQLTKQLADLHAIVHAAEEGSGAQ
jgi:hypothetical protein